MLPILCKYGANIFKAVRSIRHKYAFTVYHDWRNSIFALLIAHHKKANSLDNFAVIRKPRSSLSINLIIGNHVGDSVSGCINIHTADAAVIANSYAYLKGFAPETIATAILFSMVGYFNGNDKTLWVMVQGLVQTLLVRLPMAYIMSIQPNASLTMIGLSAPTSTAVGILLNISFFLWLKRYENQTCA